MARALKRATPQTIARARAALNRPPPTPKQVAARAVRIPLRSLHPQTTPIGGLALAIADLYDAAKKDATRVPREVLALARDPVFSRLWRSVRLP